MLRVLSVCALGAVLLAGTWGCASVVTNTASAIDNAQLTTQVKMSDTIFLDPMVPVKHGRTVYLRVTNTSKVQEVPLEAALTAKLQARGYTVSTEPTDASYIVQANLLYLDRARKGLTADGMAAGGFGGALAGAMLATPTVRSATAGAAIGALAGSLAGAAIGAAFHVDTYAGVVDLAIKERAEGTVEQTVTTEAAQGSATKVQSTSTATTSYRDYRTRVVVTATQTNIDMPTACNAIAENVSGAVAGLF